MYCILTTFLVFAAAVEKVPEFLFSELVGCSRGQAAELVWRLSSVEVGGHLPLASLLPSRAAFASLRFFSWRLRIRSSTVRSIESL